MAESKRDYYEVLGVPKDADEDALKKAQAIKRQRPSLKKLPRHTAC